MKLAAALGSIAFALAAACGNEAPPAPTPPPSSTAPVALPEPPSIARAQVDALVTEWQRAQNEADFDAYARLYDPRFVGVRRTTRASFRLDHDGWIADRRRLFQRAMRVAATDVSVVIEPGSAIVHFTQRWESGAYAEEGEKRMVLASVGDALRITAEEMLAPHVVPRGTDVVPAIAPAFETDAQTLVVLAEATDAGTGAPVDLPASGMFVSLRDAGSTMPRAFATLVGTSVQLIGEHGACASTITSVGNAAAVSPSFDTEMIWHGGDFGDGIVHAPTPRDRIALAVDRMAEHHHWVAVAGPSSCGHVRAAVLGDQAPIVWADRVTTNDAVLARIFAGDTLRSLLADARETSSEPLDDVDDAALEGRLRAGTVVHEHARAGRPSLLDAVVTLEGPCGGDERIFRFMRAGDVLTPVVIEGFDRLESVVQLGDDGVPTLLMRGREGSRRLVRLDTPPTTLGAWVLSVFGCDC